MHYRYRYAVVLTPILLAMLTGCADYRWHWDFNSASELETTEAFAREQNKTLFIFYKWYLDSEANRMHGDVLADDKVGALFQDTINILIDKASGPAYERYVNRYGVTAPPACILVAPDGRYKVLSGFIPIDRFIPLVEKAREELAGRTRSAPATAGRP